MSADAVFSAANAVALVAWILLTVAPRRRWATMTAGAIVPLVLAAAYLVLLVAHRGESHGGFSTLSAVGELFSNRWILLVGWIHYLAFDLFVGTWEVRDAIDRGIPHLVVVPCLLLTFLFGPIGYLAYYGVREIAARLTPISPSTVPAPRPSDRR